LVHHAMTIHRADGNTTTDRHRRSLGFIYYGDRAKEDVLAKDLYQKRLNQALRKEGKV
jgi:phytanoyl-CoA hydroxylase